MIEICGIFYINKDPGKEKIDSMFKTLEKRGPDSQGMYKRGFIIGHTRLSIIDVDERSNQPMISKGCVVAFNGEIYNYKKIKEEHLKGYRFKTESDTEVIIALYKKFGPEGWKYLEGMFAFIFYHESRNKLYFIRDPIGIKPLYYYLNDSTLIVASKISTIMKVVKEREIDIRPVNDILGLGYPRKPIFQHLYEFRPGYLYDNKLNSKKVNFIINKNKTYKEAIEEMFVNSDRPVGITLSGGVDSSYIAWVCSKISKNRIHTFTIGFSKDDEDVKYARELAKIINSHHHEIIVKPSVYDKNLKEGIKKLEAPFDLGSVAMTNLLASEIAKTDIKVILIGEGSDEVNGGYRRHSEKNGMRGNEIWDWYQTRIIKNDFDERKMLLGDDTCNISMIVNNEENTYNKILNCDIENELLFYHLKRIDHIVSDFGIEARVPYLDYSIVQNTIKTSFSKKINQRGNKLLLRDAALADGLPKKFAFRAKHAFKKKDFKAKEHLRTLWMEWSRRDIEGWRTY